MNGTSLCNRAHKLRKRILSFDLFVSACRCYENYHLTSPLHASSTCSQPLNLADSIASLTPILENFPETFLEEVASSTQRSKICASCEARCSVVIRGGAFLFVPVVLTSSRVGWIRLNRLRVSDASGLPWNRWRGSPGLMMVPGISISKCR